MFVMLVKLAAAPVRAPLMETVLPSVTAPLKLQCLDQRDDGTSLCHLMRAVR